MDILDVEKHDHVEEFRRQFTPEFFEQVRNNPRSWVPLVIRIRIRKSSLAAASRMSHH